VPGVERQRAPRNPASCGVAALDHSHPQQVLKQSLVVQGISRGGAEDAEFFFQAHVLPDDRDWLFLENSEPPGIWRTGGSSTKASLRCPSTPATSSSNLELLNPSVFIPERPHRCNKTASRRQGTSRPTLLIDGSNPQDHGGFPRDFPTNHLPVSHLNAPVRLGIILGHLESPLSFQSDALCGQ